MVPNSNARFFLLKAKQRDLIAACGGQLRAAAICNYGKSTVGRWADPNSPDLMPLDAIFLLEEECGRHDMTEVIAVVRGRRLAEPDDLPATSNGTIMSHHAETVAQFAELTTVAAMAFADGRLTPSELQVIDRAAAKLHDKVDDLRKAAASARAAGGQNVGEGGK